MSASFDDIPDSPVRGGLSSSVVGMKVVCIRCGSTEHSTREHDEGRIGDAAEGQTPQVEKLSTWEKKQRATEAYIAAGRAVHALSWKNHFQNKATIPDIVEIRFAGLDFVHHINKPKWNLSSLGLMVQFIVKKARRNGHLQNI